MAKLVPFIRKDVSEQDLLLVAVGKMRLPQIRLDMKKLSKIPTGSVKGTKRSKRSLAIWGTNDVFLVPAGAEAYRRDNPNPTVGCWTPGILRWRRMWRKLPKRCMRCWGGWGGRRTPATRQELVLADRLGRRSLKS